MIKVLSRGCGLFFIILRIKYKRKRIGDNIKNLIVLLKSRKRKYIGLGEKAGRRCRKKHFCYMTGKRWSSCRASDNGEGKWKLKRQFVLSCIYLYRATLDISEVVNQRSKITFQRRIRNHRKQQHTLSGFHL